MNKIIFSEKKIKIYIITAVICIIVLILLKPFVLSEINKIMAEFYSGKLAFRELGFNYPRRTLSYYQNAIDKTLTSMIWGVVITFPVFLIFYLSLRELLQVRTGRFKWVLGVFLFIWLVEVNGFVYYQGSNLKSIYEDLQKGDAYRYGKKILDYEFIQLCKKVIPAGSKCLFLGKTSGFSAFVYYLYPSQIFYNLEQEKTGYIIIFRYNEKDLKDIIGERKIYKKWVFNEDKYILGVTESKKKN